LTGTSIVPGPAVVFLCTEIRTNLKKSNPFILLVDDAVVVAERLSELLQDAGIGPAQFAQATDYYEAMAIVAENAPDIVVLDINLPGKNGLDLLRDIRAIHEEVIVIMLTNQTDAYYRKLSSALGADYFLDKSHDFSQLPGLLRELIDH
jgi:DNA-binding response OmpR family regulator